MRKLGLGVGVLLLLIGAGPAAAWQVQGHVFCQASGAPLAGVTIMVTANDNSFTMSVVTDENGFYSVELPTTPNCFETDLVLSASCDAFVTPPTGGFDFCTTETNFDFTQDFVISGCSCTTPPPPQPGLCWLTGGGQVQRGDELFSFGGNVNPGCSPTAGQGGQWNTLDFLTNLHFQGFAIQVLDCGNVEGIPPGSTSPATPFNFIEFQGTGRVQGVQGNTADFPLVYFFGRAEDRSEPGSQGQRNAESKDRLYLNVFTNQADPVGSSIMLIDEDGDPATVDPIQVLHGNLQIHVSGCAKTVPSDLKTKKQGKNALSAELPTELSFAAPGPNPASSHVALRYALPADVNLSLAVYDVTGRLVRQLAIGPYAAGRYTADWDLRDRDGQPVRNGVFFARLTVTGRTYTHALIVTR